MTKYLILNTRYLINADSLTLADAIATKEYAIYFGYTKRGDVEHCGFLAKRGLPNVDYRPDPVLTNEGKN